MTRIGYLNSVGLHVDYTGTFFDADFAVDGVVHAELAWFLRFSVLFVGFRPLVSRLGPRDGRYRPFTAVVR